MIEAKQNTATDVSVEKATSCNVQDVSSGHVYSLVTYGFKDSGGKVMTWNAVIGVSVRLFMPGGRHVDVEVDSDGNVKRTVSFGDGVFVSHEKCDGRIFSCATSGGSAGSCTGCVYVEFRECAGSETMKAIFPESAIIRAGVGQGTRKDVMVARIEGDWKIAKSPTASGVVFDVVMACHEPVMRAEDQEDADRRASERMKYDLSAMLSGGSGAARRDAAGKDTAHRVNSGYDEIDYGMPRKCAFATYAKGETHERFRENLVGKLKWYMPGVDILDLDINEAKLFLGGMKEDAAIYFSRLAIPLMDQFRKYDRVVWVDADVDVVSGMFAGILSLDTGSGGVAMSSDICQGKYRKHMEDVFGSFDKQVYMNAGVVVMDLYKIDKSAWKEKIDAGLKKYGENKFRWRDQDMLNAYFDVKEMNVRYNFLWNRRGIDSARPYAIHYCNKHGRKKLLELLSSSEKGRGTDPVDAVFVIGTGSVNGNEELRYALRNLEKHCGFVRDVYICGECPEWVDRKVVKHILWPDRFKHAKDANIIDKLLRACEFPGMAKNILFCSDDQFQTRKCEWSDFAPRQLRKYDPGDTWYADKDREWHNRLRDTLERDRIRRKKSGLDEKAVFYWQPHMWMQIDRDKFIEYAKWSGYEHRKDTIIASGYFNYVGAAPLRNYEHVFIGGSPKELPNAVHVAYCDGSYNAAMGFLKGMFPEKSRFEL